ncbi:MAG: hypothetical protein ACERIG_06085, partial [Hyphomicrobium sp.]
NASLPGFNHGAVRHWTDVFLVTEGGQSHIRIAMLCSEVEMRRGSMSDVRATLWCVIGAGYALTSSLRS